MVIDERRQQVARAGVDLAAPQGNDGESEQVPALWWHALEACLAQVRAQCDTTLVSRVAIDGTSATVLLCNREGRPVTTALMYNDTRARKQAEQIARIAPDETAALGASSSLAKAMWLRDHARAKDTLYIQHQADWICGRLRGQAGTSDYNNALKLGFDVERLNWPNWILSLVGPSLRLPEVVAPGSVLGPVSEKLAPSLGLSADTAIVAGTTDSVAAVLASGASEIGDGVTSLGSTLVLKQLSDKPVFAARYGVYSHRLGDTWLAGGASNSGGAVLKQFFSDDEIRQYTSRLDPGRATGLDYYPLAGTGERFPVADPDMKPRITPVPDDPAVLFQALLEGMTAIERRGYELLKKLGAPKLRRVFTTGGGGGNDGWTRMREQALGVPVLPAVSRDAAYGAALLALNAK